MKRVRILREPRGGTHSNEPPGHEQGQVWFLVGRIYEVPDEIAELLCAPRCARCDAAYPFGKVKIDKCFKCQPTPAQYSRRLVPGLAEVEEL